MDVNVDADTDSRFVMELRRKIRADEASILYDVMRNEVCFQFWFEDDKKVIKFAKLRGNGIITEWSVSNSEGVEVLQFKNLKSVESQIYQRIPARGKFKWVYEIRYKAEVFAIDPRKANGG